ncbi:MAG TPA: lipid II flippase MurJ, partial [bacterium]|nr:lipid II flippase MurJ [bacterium]
MKKTVASNALIVTGFNAAGLFLSFFVNIVAAARFGARRDMDIYLVGVSIPLFINAVLQGSLIVSIIPVFAEYQDKGREKVWEVASSLINSLVLATTIVCLAGMAAAPILIRLIAPGFDPSMTGEAAKMLRIYFPSIILTAICMVLTGVYYSHKRFVAPSLNSIIDPVITFGYIYFFSSSMSTKSLALALTTAIAIRTLILAAGFLRDEQFNYRPVLNLSHPGVKKAFGLIATMVVGMLL